MTGSAKPTLLCAALLWLAATAVTAFPTTPWKRAELFAICTGRLSALEASQKAERSPEAETTQRLRSDFEVMLEATMPEAEKHGVPPVQARLWQVNGWTEVAALLADAHYSFDVGRADRAARALDARITDCRALVLPI